MWHCRSRVAAECGIVENDALAAEYGLAEVRVLAGERRPVEAGGMAAERRPGEISVFEEHTGEVEIVIRPSVFGIVLQVGGDDPDDGLTYFAIVLAQAVGELFLDRF